MSHANGTVSGQRGIGAGTIASFRGALPLVENLTFVTDKADAADAAFNPTPNCVYFQATTAAARAWTMVAASVTASAQVGEGFHFWVANDGANAITIPMSTGCTAGVNTGTFTIAASGYIGHFYVIKTAATPTFNVHCLGVAPL